ncbi:MAG TPA: glycosyltransferase family 4 protein [Burkholderiales bacterium]
MLAAEQAARGHRVHVARRRGGVHETRLRTTSVEVHELGDLRGLSPALVRRIDSIVRSTKPDVIQTWLPQMDIAGGLVALWRRVPWILSERASKLAFDRRKPTTWIREFIGRRANAFVANSAAGADYWHRLAGGYASVATIRNAVDAESIRNAPAADRSLCSVGEKTLLVVGRLDHQKAVEVVIEATSLASRRDFRVLVFGEGPLRARLDAEIKRSGLDGRVHLLPYLQEWWGLLRQASGLISMSRFEGHPNVVLETMAAACPLIVSDIPEHREFLDERSALMVPRDDAGALAQAIVTLLAEPSRARERAARAADGLRGLTIAAAADAYDSIYRRLIVGGGTS